MTASKTAKTFNPYSVVIEMTSTPNFYLAQSSNKYDWYGVVMTGDNAVLCTCKAAQEGLNCRHRKAVLARFFYHDEWWQGVLSLAEAQAELDAVREMVEAA